MNEPKLFQELLECLKWYVEEDDVIENEAWLEYNAYFIAGKRRAEKAIEAAELLINTKKVCILKQDTYSNIKEYDKFLQSIKEQIETKITEGINLGTFEHEPKSNCMEILLHDIAFTYVNPEIIDNKLYVNIRPIKTNRGDQLKNFFDNELDLKFKVHCMRNTHYDNEEFTLNTIQVYLN